jgi:hypothetical protein
MFEREGFDEKQMRYDLAQVQEISEDDLYIERDDKEFIDPRTLDMPVGPTGMGETGGSGVQTIRLDGERWPTHRFVHGFSTLREDDSDTSTQEQATMEMFQYFGDVSFMTGLGPNGEYAPGVFDWLRSAVPDNRTLDCEDFDGDSGDEDLTGTEEDLLNYHAMKEIRGRLIDPSGGWDMMLGSHTALTRFNKLSGSGDGEAGAKYRDRISDVLNDQYRVPYKTQPTVLPRDLTDAEGQQLNVDDLEVTLVDEDTGVNPTDAPLGYDEAFLLPDMDTVSNDFWRLSEMGAPNVDGPIQERGGKDFYDYMWRYTHRFDPEGQYPEATDVVHIKNLSVLFD